MRGILYSKQRKGGEEMNRNKLKGRIVETYGTQGKFAAYLGRTEQTVTAKLAGRSEFTQADIVDWCNALGIGKDEVGEYFFAAEL